VPAGLWMTVKLTLAVTCGAIPCKAAESYYRYPLSHTGEYLDEAVSDAPRLVAKYGLVNVGIHGASKSSPTVDGNTVFVGADSGALYALDRRTLKPRWQFQVRRTATNGIHGTPAVDDRFVFIGAYDGWLYQLDRRTGRLVEQYKLGDYIGASPVLWEGRVYVSVETADPNGYVACVDPVTQVSCLHRTRLGSHAHGTPTIDPERNLIFVGANSEIFYALDATSGLPRWAYRTGGDIKATAALAGDRVFITSWDGSLYAFDAGRGDVLWKAAATKRSMSSPTVSSVLGLVYFGSHDGIIRAVDIESGAVRWQHQTAGEVLSSGTLARRKGQPQRQVLVIGSSDSQIYWLDAATGDVLHRHETRGAVTSVPTVRDGRIYVSGNDGFLYVFEHD
jgi:outer membrane protein assembly factor BamB